MTRTKTVFINVHIERKDNHPNVAMKFIQIKIEKKS